MLTTSSERMAIQVLLDGMQLAGLISADVHSTNHFSADTFTLTFAIGADASTGIAFWASLSSGYIEVAATLSSSYGTTSQSLITGMIDTVHIDPVQGVVSLEGRDLSSLLIDTYRQQDFVNQTASEIVASIASYHGLQCTVSQTPGIVGRYYGDGYTKLSLGKFSRVQSDWDLVVQLARQSGFDVFILGPLLHFGPPTYYASNSIRVPVSKLINIRVEHHLGIDPDPIASVQSWDSRNMVAYRNQVVAASPGGGSQFSRNGLPFLFSATNYTSQQVADAAQQYEMELRGQSVILRINIPWIQAMSPRDKIILDGTGSALDDIYSIDCVDRRYSASSGSMQSVRATKI